jgi:hypothetical protein
VRLWKNSNAFIQNINMQYDDSFARTGAKIGTSLRIRLPNDYTVRTGPALQAQDTAEVNTTLTTTANSSSASVASGTGQAAGGAIDSVNVPHIGKIPLNAPTDGSVLTATAADEAVAGGTSPAASLKATKSTVLAVEQKVVAPIGLVTFTGP